MAPAIVLAVGRVAMGVHYPTDVLGGAALGTVCAFVLWLPGLRRLRGRRRRRGRRVGSFVGHLRALWRT
jgi:membrane-associated phospholipid phosphatase